MSNIASLTFDEFINGFGTDSNRGSDGNRFKNFSVVVGMDRANAQRAASSEVGDTRWNTNNPADNYMECFDGTTWIISTGPGGSISTVENSDLGNAYILMLG